MINDDILTLIDLLSVGLTRVLTHKSEVGAFGPSSRVAKYFKKHDRAEFFLAVWDDIYKIKMYIILNDGDYLEVGNDT